MQRYIKTEYFPNNNAIIIILSLINYTLYIYNGFYKSNEDNENINFGLKFRIISQLG